MFFDVKIEAGLRHKPVHQITHFFDLLDSVIVPQVARPALLEQFHLEAASAFLERNMLRLYMLYVAEDIAGAIYTFTHRRRAYCYLADSIPGTRHSARARF